MEQLQIYPCAAGKSLRCVGAVRVVDWAAQFSAAPWVIIQAHAIRLAAGLRLERDTEAEVGASCIPTTSFCGYW